MSTVLCLILNIYFVYCLSSSANACSLPIRSHVQSFETQQICCRILRYHPSHFCYMQGHCLVYSTPRTHPYVIKSSSVSAPSTLFASNSCSVHLVKICVALRVGVWLPVDLVKMKVLSFGPLLVGLVQFSSCSAILFGTKPRGQFCYR